MRHLKGRRKLNRTSSHRQAMLRNMVTALLENERIITTHAKAKEVQRVAERVITLSRKAAAKSGGDPSEVAYRVHLNRLARRWVRDRTVIKKVFDEYGPRYLARPGGYTRVIKLGFRAGDNAPMALLELIPDEATAPSEKAA